MERAFVALGGNLGDVRAAFCAALAALPEHGVRIVRRSSLYRTRALMSEPDSPPGPDYWNAVAEVETQLEPEALLAVLHRLEARAGRVRCRRWEARPLDLDLLLHGRRVVSTPRLALPHPRLAERTFVLQPLAELAPQEPVPPLGIRVAELLARHADPQAGILEVVPW